MISAGGWAGNLAESADAFADLLRARGIADQTPEPAAVEPPGPRTPRPNPAQGTSSGPVVAPDPVATFTEYLHDKMADTAARRAMGADPGWR